MTDLRLRQLVIATDRSEHADMLQRILALGAPFVDPGVGQFGLTNAVFAIGDQFLEFVIPTQANTAAGRFIERTGIGGYMAIFQVPDIARTRAKVDSLGYRRVWNSDLDEISASHIHPADIGGAIVSFDQPRPPESWKWGGPDWKANSIEGGLTGAIMSSPNPEKLAAKWADVLDGPLATPKQLTTQDGPIEFRQGDQEKLIGFRLSVDDKEDTLRTADEEGCVMTESGFMFAGINFIID